MKITDARVVVASPGRNFVTLGHRDRRRGHRRRRRHPQRPRAGGRVLPARPRLPAADRPRRAPDRGHLAVPLQGRLLAARAGDDDRDRRGRHRAVGHQGQGRRAAGLPAARRARPATASWSTATPAGPRWTSSARDVQRYLDLGLPGDPRPGRRPRPGEDVRDRAETARSTSRRAATCPRRTSGRPAPTWTSRRR